MTQRRAAKMIDQVHPLAADVSDTSHDVQCLSTLSDGSLLPEDQRFIALLYGNGGKDLEAKELKNASESVSILFQVAHALAGKHCLII